MNSLQNELMMSLLEIGAVHTNLDRPYLWASGWKSPVYCDNRRILSHPVVRERVGGALVEMVRERYPRADALVGVATGGIGIGAIAAHLSGLPFAYIRSQPKDHGLSNALEGDLARGTRVVVVEDLVSTGGSSLRAAERLREMGYEVLGMTAIFTYGFEVAVAAFREARIELSPLLDYEMLLSALRAAGRISAEGEVQLESWRRAPERYGS